MLNILVQDSAEELSRLAGRLREAQAEGMAKDQAISQYKQSGPELALQEAIIAKGVCSSCVCAIHSAASSASQVMQLIH